MRFFSTILAGAALVSAAFGQTIAISSYPSSVQVGQTYDIKYTPATASPTFILRKGDSKNLDTIGPIDGTGSNGVFKWTVSKSLPNGQQYALEIHANGEVNFSKNDITIGGSTATAVSSGSSSASSATSSATSSASAKSTDSTLTTSASISLSTSHSSNSTISLPTLSKSAGASSTAKSSGGSVTTTGGGAPQNTGAAAQLGSSPLALIFGAVAAMAYLN